MSKAVLVQVSIYDDETKVVEQWLSDNYNGAHAWEIESLFEGLGSKVAKIIDPDYYND